MPCTPSQFSTLWANSGDPTFTGWHHAIWNFTRHDDCYGNGYISYTSLQFDGTYYNLNNYIPTYEPANTGVSNNGDFVALVQLDSTANTSESPQVYINEVNITHSTTN